jgi:hypothetical protein
MSIIVTRAGKGSPLTNNEVDANFVNLNTDKIESITSADGSVVITPTGTARDLSVAISGSTTNVVVLVRNTTGATLTKGTAVYISGATGQNPTVSKALATSDATSAQTLGLMSADLANNTNGYVTVIGLITNINTSAYTDGAQLYLSGVTAGTLTATKPYAPIHLVYAAVVEHAHPTQGKLFVKVQNGYELDELHDVAAQSPTNGQTIVFNSSNSLWEKNTVSLTAGVNGVLPTANGGTNLSSFTASGVVYASSSSVLATGSALTFDGTNLGVNGRFVIDGIVASAPANGGMFRLSNESNYFTGKTTGSGGAVLSNGDGTATIQLYKNSPTSYMVFEAGAGTEGMRLISTGLGVGTASPQGRLDVAATGATVNQYLTGGVGNNLVTGIFKIGSGLGRGASIQGFRGASSNVHSLEFYTYNSADVFGMRLDATGLGIGTNAPAYKLEVASGASDANSLFNSTNANGAHIRLASSGTVKSYIGGAPGFLASGTADDLGIRAVGSVLFATNGSGVDMALDTAGNLGLGVTPSAWSGVGSVLQVGLSAAIMGNSTGSASVLMNAYYNGSAYTYINTAAASRLAMTSGSFSFLQAPSGTAGNPISFATSMTLDSSGRLVIGSTIANAKLNVNTTSYSAVTNGEQVLIEGTSAWSQGLAFSIWGSGTYGSGYASGYIGSPNTLDKLYISGGAVVVNNTASPSWAKTLNSTSASFLIVGAGATTFYGDTGLAVNTAYTPTQRMTLDASGNLGLGVTPSAYVGLTTGRFEFGAIGNSIFSNGSSNAFYSQNTNYNSGYKYAITAAAGLYLQSVGQHIWYNAPSGTAGTPITFTQAMTLGSDGNLILGGTSPTTSGGYTSLSINNATNSGYLVLQSNGTNKSDWYVSGGTIATLRGVGVPLVLMATGADYIAFQTNGTERGRFTSSGLNVTGAITENNIPVVTQSDIGTGANEIPLNQYLGSLAYQNGDAYYNTGMTVGFRNRIINGAMGIDQRNAGASVSVTDSNQYTLDRWQGVASLSSSKFTVQQSSTAPSGFSNSILVTSSSTYSVLSTDYFLVRQKIEGFNTSDLNWGTANAVTVTLSFWVRSSLTGTFGGAVTNSANSYAYPFSYTINAANTFEQKTITIAGPTAGTWIGATNGIGLQVKFGLGVGSTYNGTAGAWVAADYASVTGATSLVGTSGATWYITGVQLEKGNIATSFDVRPYGTELALCQRYYQLVGSGSGLHNSTATSVLSVPFATVMRTSPSLSSSINGGSLRAYSYSSGNALISNPLIYQYLNPNGGGIQVTLGNSVVAAQPTFVYSDTTTPGNFVFSAEL